MVVTILWLGKGQPPIAYRSPFRVTISWLASIDGRVCSLPGLKPEHKRRLASNTRVRWVGCGSSPRAFGPTHRSLTFVRSHAHAVDVWCLGSARARKDQPKTSHSVALECCGRRRPSPGGETTFPGLKAQARAVETREV